MDRELFSSLLRDVLANIRDYEVLEKHALNEIVPRATPSMDKADNLRNFIWEGIKSLRPADESGQVDLLKWRYYNILSGRYIKGLSTAELQKSLALGERQERRMHNRAVNTLEEVLWDRLFPEKARFSEKARPAPRLGEGVESTAASADTPVSADTTVSADAADSAASVNAEISPDSAPRSTEAAQVAEEDAAFPVTLEPLQLDKIIDETAALFLQQLRARGGDLSIQVPASLPRIQADRIILRQILFYLFNQVLQCWAGDKVSITARPNTNMLLLEILACADPARLPREEALLANPLFAYWLERLNVRLFVDTLDPSEPAPALKTAVQAAFTLELPMAHQAKLLVVDDHEPAIRIIELYLSQTTIQAVGLSDPTQVLTMAQALRPRAILLDVMMPALDGWEILQNLKSDPETHPIPVIVCSVWDQPDLANILGADAFIKKPIRQADLFKELARLHLLDTPGE
jgi:CheY-like chemotaxis protein